MSQPETQSSFGDALRAARERRGLTQSDVAGGLGVKRETISHWESAKHLPSRRRTLELDAFLNADGELRQLVEHEREGAAEPLAAPPSALTVFQRVQAALESLLQRDAEGRPLGWCHNLQSGLPPTSVSTAFGIRSLLLIDETSTSKLELLGRRLREMQTPEGGWAMRTQLAARPEAIAPVVDALVRLDPTTDVEPHLALLEKSLDGTARSRPHILSLVLETVLDLRPDSPLAQELLRNLLASRQARRDGTLLWSQKVEPRLASPEPSVHHTARATAVMCRARQLGAVTSELAGEVDEALGTGVSWLLAQNDLDNTSEDVPRHVGGRTEKEYVRHFTSSWALRSLLLNRISLSNSTVGAALDKVWKAFNDEHSLWRWSNGDLPIWMTFDGLAALRLAALASLTRA